MEENSTKNRVALVKTNRVPKYTLFVQKLYYSQDKYKSSSKSHAYEKWINKFENSQILKIKKIN